MKALGNRQPFASANHLRSATESYPRVVDMLKLSKGAMRDSHGLRSVRLAAMRRKDRGCQPWLQRDLNTALRSRNAVVSVSLSLIPATFAIEANRSRPVMNNGRDKFTKLPGNLGRSMVAFRGPVFGDSLCDQGPPSVSGSCAAGPLSQCAIPQLYTM